MSDQYTKHTTHTDALDTLGTLIGPGEKRDAIHIAVFPVVAAERLARGEHVSLNAALEAEWAPVNEGVGIVDPFLSEPVKKGDRFWLLVYPRQISSLRHVWEHPKFPASQETGQQDAEGLIQDAIELQNLREASKRWLEEWIATADCPDFHTTIGAMLQQRDGSSWESDYVHFDGQDAHGEIPAEAWHHLAIYAGITYEAGTDRPKYFTCSC